MPNQENLKKGFTLAPADYKKFKIAGGNHAEFGSYGEQSGDGTANISPEEQWQETVNIILENT